MDFNLDDPLADILSDDSNDGFFGDDIKRKSTPKSKPSSAKSTVAGATSLGIGKMEDLFGIKGTATGQKSVAELDFKPTQPVQQSTTPKRSEEPFKSTPLLPKSQSVFNDDDIMVDLGFDPKRPKSAKTNLLDDILGSMEVKKSVAVNPQRPQTAGVISKDETKVISRQSTETTDSTFAGTLTPSLPRPKTATRKQSTVSQNDPLGFFTTASKEPKEQIEVKETKETPKPRRKGTTADWLGLGPEAKSAKDVVQQVETMPPKSVDIQSVTMPEMKLTSSLPMPLMTPVMPAIPASAQAGLIMANANIEAQNALNALQQQESQIMLATQLKNQEMALMEMQQNQHMLLAQQEAQFNELLQKQIARQNQLEMTIRSQQERINTHIQLLMSQPPISFTPTKDGTAATESSAVVHLKKGSGDDSEIEDVNLRAEIRRLELEKLRLEDLLANIGANHEKEIEFLESSHKKQIKVLEDNFGHMEVRLKGDIQSTTDFYLKKIEMIENEKGSIIQNYESKLKELQENHENAVKKLRVDYVEEMAVLKEDHKNSVVNIRQSKLLEFSAIQENSSYLETLRSASNHLENVTGDIQTLRDEMYTKIDYAHKEREAKLAAREKKVADSERRLKIVEETTDLEHKRLMELVEMLEVQLAKMSRETSEEQWSLRQKLISLEAERKSFEKEREFAREQLIREEQRIEELKQMQLEEKQRYMQVIQTERQQLITERAKLEMDQKLQASSEQNTSRAEAEIALKVAQDAKHQAEQERERYFGMQRQIEAKKREIVNQENDVQRKQDELESQICSLKAKERYMQESLQRSNVAEQSFNAKVQLLQSQMQQMAEREARLTRERFLLSKERLEMQNFKHKIDQSKCSLCRIGERSFEISQLITGDNKNPETSLGHHQMPPDVDLGDIFDVVSNLNSLPNINLDKTLHYEQPELNF